MATVSIWPALDASGASLPVYDENGDPISSGGASVTWKDYYRDLLTRGLILTFDPSGEVADPDTVVSGDLTAQVRGKLCTDLSTLEGQYDGAYVFCTGYRTVGDGGGGLFRWHLGSTTTIDSGMTFGSSTGRWKRVIDHHAWINVKWFGAYGAGTSTSDSAAIQAAVDYVRDNMTRRGTIYIPAGEYRISATITLPRSATLPINIRGDGISSTLLYAAGALAAADPIFGFAATVNAHSKWYTFRDMTLARSSAGRIFYFTYITNTTPDSRERLRETIFENVAFSCPSGGSYPAVHIGGGSQLDFDHCTFNGGTVGIYLDGCSRSSLRNVNQTSSSDTHVTGIHIFEGSGYTIDHCRLERCAAGGHAILIEDADNVRISSVSFEGGSEDTQIKIDGSECVLIDNCDFARATAVNATTQAALRIADGSRNVQVRGGSFRSFYALGGGGGTYKAIKIDADVDWVKFDGVKIDSDAADQLSVDAAATNVDIQLLDASSSTGPIQSEYRFVQLMNLTGTATYDPASLADGAGATTTLTVTGAEVGDLVVASFSQPLQGVLLTAWVSASNTVSVRFQNESGGTVDLASGTIKARVLK